MQKITKSMHYHLVLYNCRLLENKQTDFVHNVILNIFLQPLNPKPISICDLSIHSYIPDFMAPKLVELHCS